MDFYIIKISMYLFIALVYIFHEQLGKNTYQLLGGLYISVFELSLMNHIKKKSSNKYH